MAVPPGVAVGPDAYKSLICGYRPSSAATSVATQAWRHGTYANESVSVGRQDWRAGCDGFALVVSGGGQRRLEVSDGARLLMTLKVTGDAEGRWHSQA